MNQRWELAEDARGAGPEEAAARQIAGVFLPTASVLSLRRVGGGLSGAAVFCCQADGCAYALKRWPAGTGAARIDEVHEVMTHSQRTLGVVPQLVRSPLGTTRLGWDGYHYELAAWMDGTPFGGEQTGRLAGTTGAQAASAAVIGGEAVTDSAAVTDAAVTDAAVTGGEAVTHTVASDEATLAAVQAGAQVIACFHDSVRRWGNSSAPAPAVLRRLGRIDQLQRQLPEALQRDSRLSPTLRAAAAWLRAEGIRGLERSGELLGRWAAELVPTQVVLRDVHREHVLFTQGRVSGLVDFDAVGRDSVAADLARWVSGFLDPQTDARAIWDAAAEGYRAVLPLSPCELELAGAISQASGVILLANWVSWVALEQRDFSACGDWVDRRVSEIMLRMVPANRFISPWE